MAKPPPNAAQLAKAEKLQKTANIASTVGTIVEIGASVGTTIASIGDAKKRAIFQSNLEILTIEQQQRLAQALNNAKDANERLKILAASLSNFTSDRIGSIEKVISEQEKNRRNKILSNSIQVSALLLVTSVVIYLLIRKD
jgi:hypothetical protein